MKKLAILFLLLLILAQACLLSACIPQDDELEDEEIALAATPVPPILSVSGPQDPYAHTLTLDGRTYQLPVAYSELAADGWTGSWEADATLDANSTAVAITLRKDEQRISTSFLNGDNRARSLEDCYVGSITVFEGDADLSLPGDLGFGLTREQLLEVYGQPSETYTGNFFEELTYSDVEDAKLQFRLDSESGLVDDITIQNHSLPQVETPLAAELPEIISSYTAPNALAAGWDSFIVRYGGDLYQLPAPLTAFLDNGWELDGDATETVASRAVSHFVTLHQGEQTLRVMLQNLDYQAQPVAHCFVYMIFYDRNGTVIPLTLSGGISETSSVAEMLAAYGEPDGEHLSGDGSRQYYTYGNFYQGLEIVEEVESGEIVRIEIKNAL